MFVGGNICWMLLKYMYLMLTKAAIIWYNLFDLI